MLAFSLPTQPLRVALLQGTARPGDIDANLDTIVSAVREAGAHAAGLLVCPELFASGYELPRLQANPRLWLTPEDSRLDGVRAACRAHGVTAILGAAVRTADGGYIAAPVIGSGGQIALSIKAHLHGSERELFAAGTPLLPIAVCGWRVAVGICFDAAFPEHSARAARNGGDLYAVSALYARGDERRVDLHLGARAMDNRMFTCLANYAGATGGHVSCGLTGAWSPSGDKVRSVEGAHDALVVTELDPLELARHRTLVEFRPASPEEVAAIHDTRRQAILGITSEMIPENERRAWAEQRTPGDIAPRVTAGEVLVAVANGSVVAWGSCTEGHITGLYVRPDVSGAGLGRALMHQLEARITAAGHHRATLESSTNALRFYAGLGYAIAGDRRHDGSVPMARVLDRNGMQSGSLR